MVLKKASNIYAEFVVKHPYLIILIVFIISVFAVIESKNIAIKNMDYKNMLPDSIDTIYANKIIQDSFGETENILIAIEIDPLYKNSNEPRDIRDPLIINYIDLLTQSASKIDGVSSTSSASTYLKIINNNFLPKSKNEINEIIDSNPIFEQYISKDYEMALIKINLYENYDDVKIVKDFNELINQIPKPAGIKVELAGEIVTHPIVKEQISPDMAKTSQASLIGIIAVLILLLGSIRYGLTPLSTIGIGVLWCFGYIGLIGMGLNSATSGVISMVMGIGIDFGIQIINRFRQELKEKDIEPAMIATLEVVIIPMLTTTLAALIGFKAMQMGQLKILEDLGKMMSYGIVSCFLASITIVPSITILFERFERKKDELIRKIANRF